MDTVALAAVLAFLAGIIGTGFVVAVIVEKMTRR